MTKNKLWGFMCEHCGLHSGEAYRGENPEEYTPTCCNGKPMIPYEIPPIISNIKEEGQRNE